MFIYHYRKKYKYSPVSNPWNLNFGKLVMPNVFVNIELIRALEKNYNPKTRVIHWHNGSQFMIITRDYIFMVFQLDASLEMKLRLRELLEYCSMDTSYKRWKLPLHRPKGLGKQPMRFASNEKPPFFVELFEEYYQNTYYSAGQVLGIEASANVTIAPMVLVIDI